MGVSLSLSEQLDTALASHLASGDVEQVAFLFSEPYDGQSSLNVVGFYPVPPDGFDFQSDYHVALTDAVRATVIKRAWDCGGCLIEAHSHEHAGPVGFSRSDLSGFADWVPHVRWRLRRRPYIALVFGHETFDALVWLDGLDRPEPLQRLRAEGRPDQLPTNRTFNLIRSRDDD